MPATKRKLKAALKQLGFRVAFDSFVGKLGSQSSGLAKAANLILQKSKTFTRIVDRLNDEYLSATDLEVLGGVNQFEPDQDGKLSSGPFAGRHTLVFSELTPGNRFVQPGSDRTLTTAFPHSDFIFLSLPTGVVSGEQQRARAIAALVASIAHETVHAFNRVTNTSGSALTRAQRADAFIEEEIATRKKEKIILNELLSFKVGARKGLELLEKETNTKGLRAEIEGHVATMTLSRPEVERDFVSGTNLTYLETFVIEDLTKRSIRAEKLQPKTIEENKATIGRLEFIASLDTVVSSTHPELFTEDPKTGLRTVFLPNQFAEIFLVKRIIEEHWQDSTEDREVVVQRHRNSFFPTEIEYTPLQ